MGDSPTKAPSNKKKKKSAAEIEQERLAEEAIQKAEEEQTKKREAWEALKPRRRLEQLMESFKFQFTHAWSISPPVPVRPPGPYIFITPEAARAEQLRVAPLGRPSPAAAGDAPLGRLQQLHMILRKALELRLLHGSEHKRLLSRLRRWTAVVLVGSGANVVLLLMLQELWAWLGTAALLSVLVLLAQGWIQMCRFEATAARHLAASQEFGSVQHGVVRFFSGLTADQCELLGVQGGALDKALLMSNGTLATSAGPVAEGVMGGLFKKCKPTESDVSGAVGGDTTEEEEGGTVGEGPAPGDPTRSALEPPRPSPASGRPSRPEAKLPLLGIQSQMEEEPQQSGRRHRQPALELELPGSPMMPIRAVPGRDEAHAAAVEDVQLSADELKRQSLLTYARSPHNSRNGTLQLWYHKCAELCVAHMETSRRCDWAGKAVAFPAMATCGVICILLSVGMQQRAYPILAAVLSAVVMGLQALAAFQHSDTKSQEHLHACHMFHRLQQDMAAVLMCCSSDEEEERFEGLSQRFSDAAGSSPPLDPAVLDSMRMKDGSPMFTYITEQAERYQADGLQPPQESPYAPGLLTTLLSSPSRFSTHRSVQGGQLAANPATAYSPASAQPMATA